MSGGDARRVVHQVEPQPAGGGFLGSIARMKREQKLIVGGMIALVMMSFCAMASWAVWAALLGISPLSFAAVLGAAVVQGEDHQAVFEHVRTQIEPHLGR